MERSKGLFGSLGATRCFVVALPQQLLLFLDTAHRFGQLFHRIALREVRAEPVEIGEVPVGVQVLEFRDDLIPQRGPFLAPQRDIATAIADPSEFLEELFDGPFGGGDFRIEVECAERRFRS